MKKTTKRKYWGRSAVTGALRSAANELTQAIELASTPPPASPVADSLRKVLRSVNQAIEYERLYELGRRRIKQRLEREKKSLEELIKEVTGIPVTKDEKARSRRERKKERRV